MSALIHVAQTSQPREYALPEGIRNYFKHVATGPRGGYKDGSITRPPRLNRMGFPEDRDPLRLKDRNGDPVLCFRCGQSSLPTEDLPEANDHHRNSSLQRSADRPKRAVVRIANYTFFGLDSIDRRWKSIISCDFCSLSWHLDCLAPPLTSMPPMTRKWMCPNHTQQTIRNRRVPKAGLSPVEIRSTGLPNNGNIDIIPADDVRSRNTVSIDEVLINGRVYHVPERVIILDFWDKISGGGQSKWNSAAVANDSISSPLTSLSSLDGQSEKRVVLTGEPEDLSIARILCNLALPNDRKVIAAGKSHLLEGHRSEVDINTSSKFTSATTASDFQHPTNSPQSHVIPMDRSSPLASFSSDLTSMSSNTSDEENDRDMANGVTSLKIRIPRPLNIAVAAANGGKKTKTLPRRSLRRSTSNFNDSSKQIAANAQSKETQGG